MFDQYTQEAEFAIQVVSQAAKLGRRIQQEMVMPALSKQDRSPVTVADFASQALVAQRLQEVFPGAILVGEEGSAALKEPEQAALLEAVVRYVGEQVCGATAAQVCTWIDYGDADPEERYWTLDPIDGTKGFLRGDQYVVALALVEHGRPVVAALGCPNLNRDGEPDVGGSGSVAFAVHGEGAWIMDLEGGASRRMHTSDCSRPADCRMLRSFESGHTDPARLEGLKREMGIQAEPVLMDSQAKYVLLAIGHGEVIFRILSPEMPDYVERIWDHAAGSLIVEEAGGRVTDVGGKRLDFSRGRMLHGNVGVLATNGPLHAQALQALKAVGAHQRPEGILSGGRNCAVSQAAKRCCQ